MLNRVRALFDRIVYAGLKPTGYGEGESHLDPLYLSNRSIARKILAVSFVAIPFALIATGVYLAATGYFSTPTPPPRSMDPTKAEIAAATLPKLKDVRLETVQEVTVLDARVTRDPPSLNGTIKNNTARPLRSVEVFFDLADAGGSQLGGVTVRLDSLESGGVANFHLPIRQRAAAIAVVRETRAQ